MYKNDADLMTRTIQVLQVALEALTIPGRLTGPERRKLAYDGRLLCRDCSYYFEAMYDAGPIPPARLTEADPRRRKNKTLEPIKTIIKELGDER